LIIYIIISLLLTALTIWSRLNRKSGVFVTALILLVLLLDQGLKIWVKTHMEYGDEIPLFGLDWAKLHFVENPGMAFGLTFGGDYGKLALSLFRIFAVGFLVYFINRLIKLNLSMGLLASFALILAGALGNIIDSAFYGMIFSASPNHGGLASLFPAKGGYSGFLYGKVVDMFYFPMFRGHYPDWFPFSAGRPFLFFRPVFNIADAAISIGVVSIILFYRSFFGAIDDEAEVDQTEPEISNNSGEPKPESEGNKQENNSATSPPTGSI